MSRYISLIITCAWISFLFFFIIYVNEFNRNILQHKNWMVVCMERLVLESDLSQLNYVKACAREAFRLHPIAPSNVPHVSILQHDSCQLLHPQGKPCAA